MRHTAEQLRPKQKVAFVAIAVLAILAFDTPSQARGVGGHGGGGHPGGAGIHQGVDGHHGFEGHRFDRGFHDRFRFGFVPVVPFYGSSGYDPYDGYYPPAYNASGYWYYCPSYGAYYPDVTSCPDTWVPVPAS